MKKNDFMSGALILSIGGVLAKVFSAIYRIGITRILGGEGIGLYQLVFPLYSLCVVLATAGLPMAISKVIAKNPGNSKKVVRKSILFTSIISLVLTFILLTCSEGLATIQGDKSISIFYIILAPSIIIVSACSVFRGYFQGTAHYTPSAVSNIIEQFVKLAVGLILSLILIKISILASIIGAMISILISEIISLLILLIFYKRDRKKLETNDDISVKSLVKDIIPITLTNIIMPIATFVDSLIVVNILGMNFTHEMSIFLYGLESGAVSSLVSLPTIFSFAIASVVLPNITKNVGSNNKNQIISVAVKIILIITIPCVLAFVLIPDRLIELLYADRLNGMGVEGLNVAYRLLAISGIGVIFLAISQVYSSCLQAIEERMVTIRNLALAVAVKFIIELLFMPSLMINIYALAIANTVCYITVMVLNRMEIREHFTLKFDYLFVGKLILSNAIMVLSLILVLMLGSGVENTLLAILVAGICYVGSLYFTKIFTNKEFAVTKYHVL